MWVLLRLAVCSMAAAAACVVVGFDGWRLSCCWGVLLQGMSGEEFSRHKSSLVSNKLQSDMSLGQEGDRAWEQVSGAHHAACYNLQCAAAR